MHIEISIVFTINIKAALIDIVDHLILLQIIFW